MTASAGCICQIERRVSLRPTPLRGAIFTQVLGAMENSRKFEVKALSVLCSLAESEDGSLKVLIEDVVKGARSHRNLFSFQDPQGRDLADVSEPELAVFGQYILMRLLVKNQIGS